MKKQVYMVEVGVCLDRDHTEYDHYKYLDWLDYSLYDENLLYFFEEEKAVEYAKRYIENGTVGTYGHVTNLGLLNLDEDFIKEIKEWASAEDLWEKPTEEDLIFFDIKKTIRVALVRREYEKNNTFRCNKSH